MADPDGQPPTAPGQAAPDRAAPSHIVGVGESGGSPVLWLSEGGTAPTRPLPLRGSLSLRVGGARTCIGKWENGRRVPCPTQALVGDDAQCLPCGGLEHPECVFEPLCQGDASACLCANTFRGVEHLVYCAFYGTLPKVGMTQARRVDARLREQGADLYFVVGRGLDRAAARQLERSISFLYRIPEFRSHREVLPQLARPVPWDLVERRARETQERLEARHDVEEPLHRITDYPVQQPLPGRPRRVAPHGLHAGKWLGGKGNHIFYAEAPRAGQLDLGLASVAAVKRTDLVGYFLQ